MMKSFLLAACVAFLPASVVLAQSADLLTQKSGPAIAAAGSDVSYTVTVTNLGPDDAADVTLDDPIPGGMTFVSATQDSGPAFSCTTPNTGDPGNVNCTLALLAANATASFTFVFHIDAQTAPGTFFTNIATATTSTFDENDENNSAVATTSTPPPPQADASIQKFGPNSAPPGGDVSYTITVRNLGPDDADSFSFSDTLPGTMTFVSLTPVSGPTFSCTTPAVGAGGTITCSIISMPASATAVFTLVGNIPALTPAGTAFTNIATVTTTTEDTNEENDTSITTLTVSSVDVSVTKDGPANATAGTNISYTIVVANGGPDGANASFADDLPPNTTFVSFAQNNGPTFTCGTPIVGSAGTVQCSIPTLASGASAQFTLTVHVGNTLSVTNTVTAQANDQFDSDLSNNEDSATTAITPSADLSIVKSGPASVVAGNDLTYTITAANNGVSDAASATLSDTLPAGTTFVSLAQNSGPTFNCTTPATGANGTITCTIGTFAANATSTFTIVAHVSGAVADGATISNTATIAAQTSDPNTNDNSSTTNATATTSADVHVLKVGPTGTSPGLNTTYTVTVGNDGVSDAANVTLTDNLPANTTFVSETQNSGPTFNCVTPPVGTNGTITCTIASLVAGANATFTFVVQVMPATTFGSTVTNTATVSSTTVDPDPSDNSSTTNANVTSLADVRVSKTGDLAAHAGQPLSYTITVTNDGPTDALNVQLSDAVPANTTFVSFTQTSGPVFNCVTPAAGGTGTITCTIATLANAASATFTLIVAVDVNATGTISNTATVTSTNDPAVGNDSSTAAVTIASASIPTLSTWGLMFLAAALGLIVVLKR